MCLFPSEQVVVWDADGVLFRTFDDEGKFIWSQSLYQDLGIGSEVVDAIFSSEWMRVIRGELDTRCHLDVVFERHGVQVSVERFLAYWLAKCDTLNDDVVALLGRFKSYIASNQDPLRADHFQTIFSGSVHKVFASSKIGAVKPESSFYQFIEKALDLPSEAIWFVDDLFENVEAARKMGWRAHHFVDVSSLRLFLEGE